MIPKHPEHDPEYRGRFLLARCTTFATRRSLHDVRYMEVAAGQDDLRSIESATRFRRSRNRRHDDCTTRDGRAHRMTAELAIAGFRVPEPAGFTPLLLYLYCVYFTAAENWSTSASIQSNRLSYSAGICSVSSTTGTLASLAEPVI